MAAKPQSHAWVQFPVGTRVFDQVSGEDGVVTDVRVMHAVEPARQSDTAGGTGRLIPLPNPVTWESVFVRLDNGENVERSPKLLVGI